MSVRIGILGASGYTGAELIRLAALHPEFEMVALTAERRAGEALGAVFPHLSYLDLPPLTKVDEVDMEALDLVFCALPHALTQEIVAGLPQHLKIVDLSADFRLTDIGAYEKWYGGAHRAPELQIEAVFGLPEFYREQIAGARLVANTGCYVAASLLALLPPLKAGVINPEEIVIDAKSGVSGAGRAPKEGTLFCEVSEGFHAYGVGMHRHMAELDQELSKAAGVEVIATFTPHLIPQNRGILATIYVEGEAARIHEVLSAHYLDEYFVHVVPIGEVPQTRHVRGSNFARIGIVPDRRPGRSIIISTLDNLVRGASGQAVQNANIMLGIDERSGLMQAPLFP